MHAHRYRTSVKQNSHHAHHHSESTTTSSIWPLHSSLKARLGRKMLKWLKVPGLSILEVGKLATPDIGQGDCGGAEVRRGSWTGRETLLYLIMYRVYVRKW